MEGILLGAGAVAVLVGLGALVEAVRARRRGKAGGTSMAGSNEVGSVRSRAKLAFWG
jgi:hypothetical protein